MFFDVSSARSYTKSCTLQNKRSVFSERTGKTSLFQCLSSMHRRQICQPPSRACAYIIYVCVERQPCHCCTANAKANGQNAQKTIVFSPCSEASEKDYSFHISRLQSAYARNYSFEKKRLRWKNLRTAVFFQPYFAEKFTLSWKLFLNEHCMFIVMKEVWATRRAIC